MNKNLNGNDVNQPGIYQDGNDVVVMAGERRKLGEIARFKGSGTLQNFLKGRQAYPASASAKTGTAVVTIAEMLTGLIVGTPTAAANYTLPTFTLTDAAFDELPVGSGIEWSVINLATNDTYIITLLGGTAHTIVGVATIPSAGATTGALNGASARFLTIKTTASAFVTYRIA